MRAARVAIAALLMTGLTACSGNDNNGTDGDEGNDQQEQSSAATEEGSAPADPTQAPDPVAGGSALPEAGQCWNLTAEQLDEGMALVSTEATALECSAGHTAITVAVVGITDDQATQLEATVTAGTAVDPTHADAWRAVVGPACSGAFNDAFASGAVPLDQEGIAAAYKASTLAGYGWLPTAQEWQSGARWIRCDIANQAGEPISFDQPSFDLQTIPDELVACMAADVEGSFAVPCDDPLANAQALVTVVLDGDKTTAARSDYEAFQAEAGTICADAVTAGFPNAGKPGLAALPIEFAFTGTFDCYVERAAGEPLVK